MNNIKVINSPAPTPPSLSLGNTPNPYYIVSYLIPYHSLSFSKAHANRVSGKIWNDVAVFEEPFIGE